MPANMTHIHRAKNKTNTIDNFNILAKFPKMNSQNLSAKCRYAAKVFEPRYTNPLINCSEKFVGSKVVARSTPSVGVPSK